MADIESIPPPELPLQRLGSGRAAEVFTWSPGLVVKLAREEQFEAGLELEAAALRTARDAGVPVPEPLGLTTYDGKRGLVMERVDGRDIFAIIEKQPWRVWSLASLVGRLHAQLGGAAAPDSATSLIERAGEILAGSTCIPEAARPRLQLLLDLVADGSQLCHMDFHPGNVMLTDEGPYIIDFPNAVRGPAVADHAKSWVVFSAGAPTPGMGKMARLMIAVFRKLARTAYMRAYRRSASVDQVELARWKAILVAGRLEEGIPEERETLLRLLSRTLREAGA